MRLLAKSLDKNHGGSFKLLPSDPDDLWHAYNLISLGDHVTGSTYRKVNRQTSTTGSVVSEKVRITLTLQVTATDFDAEAGVVRVTGKNATENQFVKMGAFHTLEIEPDRSFVIFKNVWDSVFMETLNNACNPEKNAELAAIVMQEGLANVCVLANAITFVKAKIVMVIPKKGAAAAFSREKALSKFYDSIVRAIVQHIDLEKVKNVLIASPGFLNEEFYKHLIQTAQQHHEQIIRNKSKFILCHASSGHKHALDELLSSPELVARLGDIQAFSEANALSKFHVMMNNQPEKAVYGPAHVYYANSVNAIETLLITDNLFRNSNVRRRKMYVEMVEGVKNTGGQVFILSSMNVTGEQLEQMSGVAAILRFPITEIDDIDLNEELQIPEEAVDQET